MAAEGEDIYIDLKKLRGLLKRAQFLMDKADRIVYGTPTLENCTRAIEAFVLTYDFKEDRKPMRVNFTQESILCVWIWATFLRPTF